MFQSMDFPAHSGGSPDLRTALSRSGRSWSTVLARLVVLGLGLAVLKILLVAQQGRSLYEAHWRLNSASGSWVNYAAFYFFLLLGVLGLAQLSRCYPTAGLKGIRALNVTAVVLALSFIFLTFHNGNRNYFYPVVSGLLKWTSLGPYLANALFFNQPFLAGWILAYAFSYYVLIRLGWERSCLLLTAAFAAVYSIVHLRELAVRKDELLLIDSLGVLALVAAWCAQRYGMRRLGRWGLASLSLPFAWTVFFAWALLRFDSDWRSFAAGYFLELLLVTCLLFSMAVILIRRRANPVLWAWFVPFFGIAYLLLCDSHYPSSENYNHLLCLALTFPRYFAGELLLLTVMGLSAWAYLRVRPFAALWWMDVLGVASLTLAAVDLRLAQITGVRLGWDLLSFGDSPKMMLKLAKPYLPGIITGLIVMVGIYLILVRMVQTWIGQRVFASARGVPSHPATGLLVRYAAGPPLLYAAAVFLACGLVGLAVADGDKVEGQVIGRLVSTSPVWRRVANRIASRDELLTQARSLGLANLGQEHAADGVKSPRDLNVLVVFMESSYNKHLSLFGSSEETQPLLSKYKNRMELFPNYFSAFAGSIHARFATFTSLYPVLDFHSFTQEPIPVKSFFEVLHDRGYSCSMFYSSYFDYTGFRDFLKNRGLDEMYDADTMPGDHTGKQVEWGLLEEETLGAIRSQLKSYAQTHRRFCLTYVPAAPHNPFDKIPKAFQKYKMKEVGDFTPVYLNELLYMDWVIASIIDELKDSGLLNNTMVVITNDHGEMLGGKEDANIGHGWAITPRLANTPLIIMDPAHQGLQVNTRIGTQVDFLPTILDRLNIPLPSDQLYEGQSLDDPPVSQDRLAYLNSYRQFGIVEGDKILLGDRERKTAVGVASGGATYKISNDGAKTIFTETEDVADLSDRVSAMARFDAFQENFLRNYTLYCRSVHGPGLQLAKKTGN